MTRIESFSFPKDENEMIVTGYFVPHPFLSAKISNEKITVFAKVTPQTHDKSRYKLVKFLTNEKITNETLEYIGTVIQKRSLKGPFRSDLNIHKEWHIFYQFVPLDGLYSMNP